MTADERIKQLEAEVAHWKANHTNEVRRARILKDRPDMPIERVRAYEQLAEKDAEIDRLKATIVMRFDHDTPPQFEQGYSEHEALEPVTAEHCRWFVREIESLRQQLAQPTDTIACTHFSP